MSTSVDTFEKPLPLGNSPATMRAGVLCGVEHLEVRDVPAPISGPHEVVVRVSAVGLCGTDAHIFAGHANYNTDEYGQPIPFEVDPQILGHEISGCIEEVGSEVRDLKPGDRVVVDQGLNCNSLGRETLCEYCRTAIHINASFMRSTGSRDFQVDLPSSSAFPR